MEDAATVICDEYARTDAGVTVTVGEADGAADAWSVEDTGALLDLVALVPTGPLAMSPDFVGVVETSTSVGEAITERDELTLHSLSRSANDAAMPAVIATLEAAARLAGGRTEVKHNHGGWRPNLDSPVLAAATRVFQREFGAEPIVTGVHIGLEPAVIGAKLPGLAGPDRRHHRARRRPGVGARRSDVLAIVASIASVALGVLCGVELHAWLGEGAGGRVRRVGSKNAAKGWLTPCSRSGRRVGASPAGSRSRPSSSGCSARGSREGDLTLNGVEGPEQRLAVRPPGGPGVAVGADRWSAAPGWASSACSRARS